ncbi:general transcription factor II-I repeat domain-containing protein 2-like [Ixodes scapularis]|uniref:general transcription factor II-I repeat domain-containing protein 2-like n=1 Tax=Ixodes scapularis TaxID=6945 RepID=UPI001C381E6F|nr:general transcription factor II-I repeat domain-containing protein 2-like [Ixodes scapularis]
MTSNTKRKYEDEHRTFLLEWVEDFAFTEKSASSELRKVKLAQLKSRLQNQQSLMKTFTKESDVAAEASFAIAWNIARTKRAYSEGEFVKPCWIQKTRIFKALDESMDIQDKPQLAIFVRYVSCDESVREELLDMVALKETTRGVDIKNALLATLERFDVPLQKLVAIATDGAPAMLVFSFQNKLKLFQKDLKTKRLIHFPRLKSMLDAEPEFELTDAKLREYFLKLEELERDFHFRFKDKHQLKPCFALLMNPFMVGVLSGDCPAMKNLAGDVLALELELLELQEDEGLKTFPQSQKIAVFWGQMPEARCPHVKLAGQKLLSIFGSTYCCEAVFSTMKVVK